MADGPEPSLAQSAAGLVAALRRLDAAQRRVCLAAALLLASMLLPWYSKSTAAVTSKGLQSTSQAKLALTVFSFVEAAIFLVAVAAVLLMLARGRGRAFHLPGGDGTVVVALGAWAAFLVFYRFLDQPAGSTSQNITSEYNLSWGIFFGLLAAFGLLYAGLRLKAAHLVEPPLPGDVAPSDVPPARRAPDVDGDPGVARVPEVRRRPSRDEAHTVVDRDDSTSATSVAPRRPEDRGSEQLRLDDGP